MFRRSALLASFLLLGIASAATLPLNPFADRLASLDDAVSSYFKLGGDVNTTSRTYAIAERCTAELSTFDSANPSISTINAKIQEYTDAFFAAEVERLVSNLDEKMERNQNSKHPHKIRLDVENPMTPMYDWKFHQLCGDYNGRVCQAQLEFELNIPNENGRPTKISVETSSARCVPAEALTTCLAHDSLKSLQEEMIAACGKLSHDGMEAHKCRVHAFCGPTVNHSMISKFGWVHWVIVAVVIVVSLAIFGAIVRRIVRCVRNRRANKCAQNQCNAAKSAKIPSDDAEAGTPLVMMVQAPTGVTYMTPYPVTH